jgi:hypothetical protein
MSLGSFDQDFQVWSKSVVAWYLRAYELRRQSSNRSFGWHPIWRALLHNAWSFSHMSPQVHGERKYPWKENPPSRSLRGRTLGLLVMRSARPRSNSSDWVLSIEVSWLVDCWSVCVEEISYQVHITSSPCYNHLCKRSQSSLCDSNVTHRSTLITQNLSTCIALFKQWRWISMRLVFTNELSCNRSLSVLVSSG